MEKNKFIVIIPARYDSTRFPGKPLAKINGVEMIVRVCRRVNETGIPLVVATDDLRIAECVEASGFRAVMTKESHPSGTDRVFEAYRKLDSSAEVIINVQGDEPFIAPEQILALAEIFDKNPDARIATLVREFDKSKGFDALFDPNVVKVTRDYEGNALYFSRSIIPYIRNYKWEEWLNHHTFFTHIGIYAYKNEVLEKITQLPKSSLEIAESLEQLRWLENGIKIKTAISKNETIGIDTPEDLQQAEEWMKGKGLK